MSARCAAVSTCVLVLVAACARTAAPPATGEARLGPGPLLPADAIGEDLLWRQRVTATWSDRAESFDAALQVSGAEMVLIGFGPMERPGFIVRLTSLGVTLENRGGRNLPFDPAHIVGDVQKAFYPWLPTAPPGFSGTRTARHEALSIEETHVDGVLTERRFERDDALDRGALVVRYRNWRPGLRAPGIAVIDNQWFGYQLRIVTVQQQPLHPPESGSDEGAR